MVVGVSDSERRPEIEQCNYRERLTLFWSDLVSCVLDYIYDPPSSSRRYGFRVLQQIRDWKYG